MGRDAEGLSARDAHVGPLTGVYPEVIGQMTRCSEGRLANATVVRPSIAVYAQVNSKRALLDETLLTDLTLVGALTRVSVCVHHDVR